MILKDKCDLKDSKKGHQTQGLGPGRDTYGACHRRGWEEMTPDSQERRVIVVRGKQKWLTTFKRRVTYDLHLPASYKCTLSHFASALELMSPHVTDYRTELWEGRWASPG